MSSTLSLASAHYFLEQPHPPRLPSDERPDSLIPNHNWAPQEERSWQRLFRNGLPTPPTSKAMTGLTLKNHYNNGVHARAQRVAQYPHHDAGSGENGVGERNVAGRDPDQLVHHDRSHRHRSSASRDFGFDAKNSSSNVIAANFRIPESVNRSGGSMAEFAAEVGWSAARLFATVTDLATQITCLFWFESAATLRRAEEIPDASLVDRGLVPDATPSIGFRKWVTTILTTTLVSKNVILLALLFIYRLKKFNTGVSGKRGSEFRLFTIALMLGNKCR
jgi:hypothetical protein